MNRLLSFLAALVLALVAFPNAALAQDYPPVPAGPVYDGADILSPATEAALDARLKAYNQETGRAIIVATVPTIDGAPIEPYATGLFAEWGIGGTKRDQGLLLLIAKEDRKLRIEVGYGLHPYFGGIMAGRVINDVITPRFKQDDYDGGVTAGVAAIVEHLARSPADAAAVAEAAEAAAAQESSEGGFPIGSLFWIAFLFFFFILPAMRGGKRRRYRSGVAGAVGDIILWEAGKAIINAASDGDGGWGGGGGFGGGGGGGGFGGFGGGMSGGGGASGSW